MKLSKIHIVPESLEDLYLQDDDANEREGRWLQFCNSCSHSIQHGFTSFVRVHTSHTWLDVETVFVNPNGYATNDAIYVATMAGCDLYFN